MGGAAKQSVTWRPDSAAPTGIVHVRLFRAVTVSAMTPAFVERPTRPLPPIAFWSHHADDEIERLLWELDHEGDAGVRRALRGWIRVLTTWRFPMLEL